MRLNSVVAVIFIRDHDGQHFALNTREQRFAHHRRDVKRDAIPHRRRIERHDMNNMPNSARALDGFVKLRLQQSCCFGNFDLFNPGHVIFSLGQSQTAGVGLG